MSKRRILPLRGRAQFRAVLRRATRSADPSRTVLVYAVAASEPDALHVAVIVPRAICPGAVGRNRLRRLVRESIRLLDREHPTMLAPFSALVVRWRTQPPTDCKRLRLKDVLPLVRSAVAAAGDMLNR